MQVSPVSNKPIEQHTFGEFKLQKSAAKKLTQRELELVKTWQNELTNTKYFDLVVGTCLDRIAISINQKQEPHNVMYGVLKMDSLNGRKIKAHGNDGLDLTDGLRFALEFPTKARAKEVYNNLKPENNQYPATHPLNKISRAVESVKALEEAYTYYENKPNENLLTKIKNFLIELSI